MQLAVLFSTQHKETSFIFSDRTQTNLLPFRTYTRCPIKIYLSVYYTMLFFRSSKKHRYSLQIGQFMSAIKKPLNLSKISQSRAAWTSLCTISEPVPKMVSALFPNRRHAVCKLSIPVHRTLRESFLCIFFSPLVKY